MRRYDPGAALISLHIPKTGGTSLAATLETWFDGGGLRYHRLGPDGSPPQRHALAAGVCVHGHFNAVRGFGVDAYYPDVQQFITFLRDPFERFLSYWFFVQTRQRAGFPTPLLDRDPEFSAFLAARIEEQSVGRNAISLFAQLPALGDCADFGALLDRRFVFVGVTERYQDSLDALAAAFGKPQATMAHLNTTERPAHDLVRFRPLYERHFAAEFEFYEAACSRNTELIRKLRS